MYQQMMNAISQKTALINGSDYYIGENGLKFCNKCKTPMQADLNPYNRQMGIVDCLCKCKTEARDRNEQSDIKLKKQNIIERLRCDAFSDKALRLNTFNVDKYNLDCVKTLKAYCNKFIAMREKGEGLLLYGNYGTGKTFYASCVVNEIVNIQYKCLFTNFSQLAAKSEYGFNLAEYLNKYSLVVFDDLGVERTSEYMLQVVYDAIDCRYRARLPMIITTNLTMTELKNPTNEIYQRVYGRILERCFPINFNLENLRKEETKNNFTIISTELEFNSIGG